jgi:hypothetical protein
MKSKRKIQFYKLIQIKKNRLKEQGPDHKKNKIEWWLWNVAREGTKNNKEREKKKKKFNHRQTTRD